MNEEELSRDDGDKFPPPPLLDFFDFFTEEVDDFVVFLGVWTFSTLEFSPLGSLPLLVAGCRGDFCLGDSGLFAIVLEVIVASAESGDDGNGCSNGAAAVVVEEDFLSEFRLSKRGLRLQFGCRTGRPLMWDKVGLPRGLDLEEHILDGLGI